MSKRVANYEKEMALTAKTMGVPRVEYHKTRFGSEKKLASLDTEYYYNSTVENSTWYILYFIPRAD